MTFSHYGAKLKFLLTCLLRGMTSQSKQHSSYIQISTHMPLARHDQYIVMRKSIISISTHMPLARHDWNALRSTRCIDVISTHMPLARHDVSGQFEDIPISGISTHMPLARHDVTATVVSPVCPNFYSHASCEA